MKTTLRLGIAIATIALVASAASAEVYVRDNNLGVGTDTPTRPIHLFSDAATADFLFQLKNGTINSLYNFKINGVGKFAISRIGTSGAEMTLSKEFDAEGDTMVVRGSVQATNFKTSSSRALKTELEAVDPQAALAGIVELPITRWSFNSDTRGTPHVGPMAEDFHQAFGLGDDNRHISFVDANGVTMAAIQGLYELVQAKDEQIEELNRRLAELEARLDHD